MNTYELYIAITATEISIICVKKIETILLCTLQTLYNSRYKASDYILFTFMYVFYSVKNYLLLLFFPDLKIQGVFGKLSILNITSSVLDCKYINVFDALSDFQTRRLHVIFKNCNFTKHPVSQEQGGIWSVCFAPTSSR